MSFSSIFLFSSWMFFSKRSIVRSFFKISLYLSLYLLEDFRDSVEFLARDNRLLKKERDMYKSMYENIARLVYGEDYETKTRVR